MRPVFIIGIPVEVRKRFVADAVRGDLPVTVVPAARGDEGYYGLTPTPEYALYNLHAYMDDLAAYADARIVVLPYTPLPGDLEKELKCLKDDFGADVAFVKTGANGWPKATVSEFNSSFRDAVYEALVQHFFPAGKAKDLSPTECFKGINERCPNIIIPGGAIDLCDKVARHRYKFMRNAAHAFEALATDGLGGPTIEEFFGSFKLQHAQSGGIDAGIKLFRSGDCVYTGSSQTHLKEGDGTSPVSAARIYYYWFEFETKSYLAILYAGPHPDTNVNRLYKFD